MFSFLRGRGTRMRRSRWWQRKAKVRSRGCSYALVKVCSVTKRGWESSLFSRCLVVFNVMLVSNKRSRRQVLAGFHRLFSPSPFFGTTAIHRLSLTPRWIDRLCDAVERAIYLEGISRRGMPSEVKTADGSVEFSWGKLRYTRLYACFWYFSVRDGVNSSKL